MLDQQLFIAEILPEPLLVLSDSGNKVIWINSAAETWLQRSSDGLKGKGLCEISFEFETIQRETEKAAVDFKTSRSYDVVIKPRNGQSYICDYVIFPCSQGIAILIKPKIIGIENDDIWTRGKSVTMLGRMLAHELKNPLAGIRGAAQLLESELKDPDNLELTSLIKTEVDRIGRLTEQMEKFDDSDITKHIPFNIHKILRKAALLFQSQDNYGIDLIENYDPSLPPVLGDQDALMQVIVNLISNSIEAIQTLEGGSDYNGRVEIQTLFRAGVSRRDSQGQVRALPIEVRVIDNGPGITPEVRDRIFQPFVTTKTNGHGLGLALVAKIIAEHGGLLDMKSSSSKTIFSMLLPISSTTDTSKNNE